MVFKLGPDAGEAGQRPIVIDREPDDVLFLGLWIRLRRVFGEAVERHQAAVFRLQPAAPVRRRGVADVGYWRSAGPRRWWHAPPHQHQLALRASIADDGRRIVGKHARHRRKVADVTVHHAEERADRFLIGGDAVEIAEGCRRIVLALISITVQVP